MCEWRASRSLTSTSKMLKASSLVILIAAGRRSARLLSWSDQPTPPLTLFLGLFPGSIAHPSDCNDAQRWSLASLQDK